MMKKTLTFLLAIALTVSIFAGCTESAPTVSLEPTTTPDPCANGHTVLTIAGYDKTCTTDGLTEKKICSVCNLVIEEAQVIPAGHEYETISGKAATLTEAGYTEQIECAICHDITKEREEIPALVYSNERYNENEPLYIVKKVSEGFSWDDIPVGLINVENYKDRVGYDAEAQFQVAHDDENIYVRFYAANDVKYSIQTETNAIVCGDACFEFFISYDGDYDDEFEEYNYYNFEMNSNGALHVGHGFSVDHYNKAKRKKYVRTIIDPSIIEANTSITILPESCADNERGAWGLVLTINKNFFKEVTGSEFPNGFTKAGFYKCASPQEGSNLVDHLLAWNTIDMSNPNNRGFHTLVDFGNLAFEE